MSLKEAHQSFSSNSRGPVREDQRLQIKELDEWLTHKPRTPDKSKLRQNEPDTSPNQLKVGDKVLLDAADPHIVTTTPNEEIPLTVFSIFPFGTVEVSHPKFSTFKVYDVVFTRKEIHYHRFKEKKMSIVFLGIIKLTYGTMLNVPSSNHNDKLTRLQGGVRALVSSTPMTSTSYGACRKARHRPSLFHRPCNSAPDGAASEGGNLHWPLRDSTGVTLRALQHPDLRIIPHPHRPDVSTRHLEHA
ncbi:hypothetical protein GOBAR_AA07388 [Gossypium barbadense]|uniref:Uncharacterized protein n=1 Tax=Gossypium barbadense TaxID=3634 RepID=A0A2P5YCG1_GOSBA|nr:hypothetical protein GOBAR_AA07388 [Gossypium barbadense]